MSGKLSSVALLAALTIVLPELLTGNTPVAILFTPPVILFLVMTYGIPILMVREAACRLGTGVTGILLIGCGYGLLNEGVAAKTIFRQTGLPIDAFDNYGMVLGVNLHWTAFMCAWHALASVLFPIMLTHALFPRHAGLPWMGKWLTVLLALISALFCGAFFLSATPVPLPDAPLKLALLAAVMALLAGLGARLKGAMPSFDTSRPRNHAAMTLALTGASACVPMIALSALAGMKVPLAAYFGLLALILYMYARFIRAQKWLSLPALGFIALGFYTQTALFSMLALKEAALCTALLDAAALGSLWQLTRRAAARQTAGRIAPERAG